MPERGDPPVPAAALARPPVIVMGGGANALSVARNLGRRGVKVYAINHPDEHIRYSRYAQWLPLPPEKGERGWEEFLLGEASDHLSGAVLLTCSDGGIQILARHREALSARFRLDECNPAAQLCMLDKLCTYRTAVAAGVPTPRFWTPSSRREVEGLLPELSFPLMVKPRLSHTYEAKFHRKYALTRTPEQLLAAFDEVEQAGIEAMLVEMIEGPDDRSCSYYTYLDEQGEPLFDFTKRLFRRFPTNMGGACYHITDWNPEVKELSLKLLRQAGVRGLANVEFKRDRAGELKLIECNARFTAADCLVAESGYDLAWFVYCRINASQPPAFNGYRVGLRLWDPLPDFRAYRELRRRGELTLWRWLASLAHPKIFSFFRWYDPLPSVVVTGREAVQSISHHLRRATGLSRRPRPTA